MLWQEFVQNRASDPMFILGEMIFQITGCTITKNECCLNKIVKAYTQLAYTVSYSSYTNIQMNVNNKL